MKKIYVYYEEEFEEYKKQKETEGIEIVPISKINKISEELKVDSGQFEIDLTSLGMALENRSDLVFSYETVLERINNKIRFVVSDKYSETIKELFKFDFCEFANVFENKKRKKDKGNIDAKKIKICEFQTNSIEEILKEFDKKIYGHKNFKSDLKRIVSNYRILNKLGEQKVLSIFIMGDSGTGKTEVASQLYKISGGKNKLCKISFANYSSKDSLNSLIGSPRGYIGSDDGELVKKVKKTDVGIILIDEFERADEKVHNFFLELLEKGSFSDSQGNDYDLNGYIIFFTSNMNENKFKQNVLPELISRFDYVGRFNKLRNEDKIEFIQDYIEELASKYSVGYKKQIDDELKKQLISKVDVDSYDNIRTLKKYLANIFIEAVSKE